MEDNSLQCCDGFSHTSTNISQSQVYMCPSILKPPPTFLLTLSLWVVPEHLLWVPLLHASHLHWSSVLHTVIYMFQCYSLKSSHPRLLPLSLFFLSVSPLLPSMLDRHYCLSKLHIFNINKQYLSFSFWLTSYCKICFNFIHLNRTDSNMFLFIAE